VAFSVDDHLFHPPASPANHFLDRRGYRPTQPDHHSGPEVLIGRGHSEADIDKILGENFLRVLQAVTGS
jgi:hypothetical protein